MLRVIGIVVPVSSIDGILKVGDDRVVSAVERVVSIEPPNRFSPLDYYRDVVIKVIPVAENNPLAADDHVLDVGRQMELALHEASGELDRVAPLARVLDHHIC